MSAEDILLDSEDRMEKAMGVLMILFALLIATDSVNWIAQWMLETFPTFQNI